MINWMQLLGGTDPTRGTGHVFNPYNRGKSQNPANNPSPQRRTPWLQQTGPGGMNKSDLLLAGMGMLSGRNFQEGMGNAAQYMAYGMDKANERQKEAQQKAQLAKAMQGMDLTPQQRALMGINPGGVTQALTEQAFATPEAMTPYQQAMIDLRQSEADYEKSDEYLQRQKEIAALRGGNQGNVQSQFVTDDGRLGFLRRDGSVEITDTKLRNPFQITDVGGVPTAIDRLTAQGIQVTTPEAVGTNKATIETITANESARQQAQQELPKAVATIDRGIATLESLKSSPGFDQRYGLMSVIPVIPGTDMADTQALINQIGGQAFLTAFESLKGGGQITEIEGQKATQAITTLTTQSIRPETAARAIEDLIAVQQAAKDRMAAQASGVYAAPGANQNIIEFDPTTGKFGDE
ncbi:MAG: hypothetical protein EP341_03060 [Sphingomonadales bacterium]|nr:MAG: hypothetical protein EP341_03060 [Sphingomonadales bacterium]